MESDTHAESSIATLVGLLLLWDPGEAAPDETIPMPASGSALPITLICFRGTSWRKEKGDA